MDKYMTSFTGDRSRSFSGDSEVSLRSSTSISVESGSSGFYNDQAKEVQDTLEDTIKESMQSWKLDVTHRSLSWSLFPTVFREAWVDLFIRYNTPLPSSAAVERMFCTGGDIPRAKSSSLAGNRFEHFVFLKAEGQLEAPET